MNRYKVTITPSQGGGEFELPHVSGVKTAIGRVVGPDGRIANDGHQLSPVTIVSHLALQSDDEDGPVEIPKEVFDLAAAHGQAAYCSGEIQVSVADDDDNVAQTWRWDRGCVSLLEPEYDQRGMMLRVEITPVALTIDESPYRRRVVRGR